jgi:hypothetical protein
MPIPIMSAAARPGGSPPGCSQAWDLKKRSRMPRSKSGGTAPTATCGGSFSNASAPTATPRTPTSWMKWPRHLPWGQSSRRSSPNSPPACACTTQTCHPPPRHEDGCASLALLIVRNGSRLAPQFFHHLLPPARQTLPASSQQSILRKSRNASNDLSNGWYWILFSFAAAVDGAALYLRRRRPHPGPLLRLSPASPFSRYSRSLADFLVRFSLAREEKSAV